VENYDPEYLVFEATAKLMRAGKVSMVFVPVRFNREESGPNRVSEGIAEVMTRVSRIGEYQLISINEIEPIRLNTVRQVRDFLVDKDIHSILVVSPGFSSRRSFLVYQSVFESTGIEVTCLPIFGERNPENWSESWHGIQEVLLEFGKLWYYRLWVL